MAVKRLRVDSIKNRTQKTRAELQAEVDTLTQKNTALEGQIDNAYLALCDVYEQLITATGTEGGPD